jgi:hypothetical protein
LQLKGFWCKDNCRPRNPVWCYHNCSAFKRRDHRLANNGCTLIEYKYFRVIKGGFVLIAYLLELNVAF